MIHKSCVLVLLGFLVVGLLGCSHELTRSAKRLGGDARRGTNDTWHVDFSDTGITDGQFISYCQQNDFARVKRILNRSRITDDAIIFLNNRKDLDILECAETEITDKAIASIVGSTEMYTLRLNGTNVTDACIADILTLKNLASLIIYNTGITENGIARIKKGLPNCLVFDDSFLRSLDEFKNKHKSRQSR